MRLRYGFAAVVLAVAVAGGAHSAGAASSVESGWWTSAPVALGPDVADDQLLVQGGVDPASPVAYAGISFALADGETPGKLVLEVASGSGSTPGATVSACALGTPATPSQGEPADLGPPFDCGTKVDATPSGDGARYEFDVARFAVDGALDVALVPAGPTARVVFQKPTADALQGGAGSTSTGSVEESGYFDGGVGGDGGGALQPRDLSLGDAGTFGAGFALPAAAAPPAASAVQPRADDSEVPTPRVTPVAATQQALGGVGRSRSPAPLVFGGLAIAAAVLWALAGNSPPETAADAGELP